VFTQEVPFYQWQVKEGDTDSIFGSQSNDWYTKPFPSNEFFTYKYQNLDRLNQNSRYFRTNGSTEIKDYKGYIYSVSGTTGSGTFGYNSSSSSQDPNTTPFTFYDERIITVGAPFHFYFGLKKGKTAFDRFAIKWIGFETITD
jgi:hypothetical protein